MLAQQASEQTGAIVPPSKIDQFPAELLVEIFALCWRSFTPLFGDIDPSSSNEELVRQWVLPTEPTRFKTEIARLAHVPLLAVAQVCAKWRSIAMGTSFLWCDIELDSVLWNSPDHSTTALALLELTLTRGGNSPLNITLTEGEHPFPSPVFTMLGAHSHRWETFTSPGYFIDIDTFSRLHGKLPRLRKIQLDAGADVSGSLATWGSMPSLTSLVLVGEIFTHDKLPLEQLRQFQCTTQDRFDTEHALSLMSLLPTAAEFRLGIHFLDHPEDWSDHEKDPVIASNISTFYLQLIEDFDAEHSLVVLECVLEAVTLPLLTQFELESTNYPRCPLLWPHRAFLALSVRSTLDSTLTTLEIYDVHITQEQLIECLSHLPSLERLAISDHQSVAPMSTKAGKGADEVLITDTLLTKLTRAADFDAPSLVPRLSSLGCQTLMRFDDHKLLALAVSRISDDSDAGQAQNATASRHFGIELSWLPNHERKIDEAVLARLDSLKISTNRRFTFRVSAAEDEWI